MLFFQEGPGVRNTQYTSSGVKLLNVANLVDGKVDLSTSYRYISEDEAYGKYRHFLCDEGDFIVASSGIKVDYIDKKMGFISREMLPLCMNTSTIRFKVLDGSKLNIKYFMYFLKSTAFKKQLAKQITGSAQLNYGPSHLKQMTFPLIDIKIQNDLVQKLDSIMRIIDQKNASLKKLDELVKARFVEMFKGKYDSFKVDEKLKTTSGGTPKSSVSEYYDGGDIPWLTSGEVNYGDITKSSNYITEKGLNNSSAKWVPENSIVIAMYGATAGKVGIVRYKTTTNQAVCSVLPNDNFNQEFLRYAFQDISEELTSKAIGGGQPNISQTIIKNSYIVDAPIEEQERFASFAKQVDKSKFAVQKSLEKTQLLFDSLMQEYFG